MHYFKHCKLTERQSKDAHEQVPEILSMVDIIIFRLEPLNNYASQVKKAHVT